MRSVSFDEALERAGYGRFQRRLLVICGLGWAADAMEVLLVSFALPAMAAEWSLSAAQKGLLATAIFLGMLAGAVFWGRLSDLIGRKAGFILTVAIDSAFGLASAFAPGFAWFLVLRALTGFGVGGTLPVDYGMFSEYLPAKNRGRRLVLLESFWALGTVAAAGLAWLVVPRLGWRWLFAFSALPGLLLFAVRKGVPESPRFLFAKGRAAEARAVLERVAAVNGTSLPEGEIAPLADVEPGRTSDLLAPRYRRTTLLLWLVWFMISIGYYGAFTWLPSWFRTKGFSLPSVYPNAFIMALAQLPGYFSAAWLVERWGRRRTLGAYLLASGACAWLFALAVSPVAVTASAVFLSFFALGAWGALYAYTPEAYPTSIRTTGIGAASGMTRIAGAVAPAIGAALAAPSLAGRGIAAPLAVFAVAYAVAGVGALLLPSGAAGEPIS
ncbi:MAG: MFS transporter [Spirochaetes bacterium]|nr:MFS transporter [Spirochaetota bacterium]